jgi:GNAT superfamily N-acetyltransferase
MTERAAKAGSPAPDERPGQELLDAASPQRHNDHCGPEVVTSTAGITVRPYQPDHDLPALKRCFIELQEFERALDPRMPAGVAVVDDYLELLFSRCEQYSGRIFVAEPTEGVGRGSLAGYVCVWGRTWSEEPDDGPLVFAFISDFLVLPAFRRQRVGRRLLAAAEAYAREHGACWLRLGMKAANEGAGAFYAACGFAPFEVQLEKSLG